MNLSIRIKIRTVNKATEDFTDVVKVATIERDRDLSFAKQEFNISQKSEWSWSKKRKYERMCRDIEKSFDDKVKAAKERLMVS